MIGKLKYHFMPWQVYEKRKAWAGEAAVWLLTVYCVVIGTEFNNQTAERVAAKSNSPACVQLRPGPQILENRPAAKLQIWSCFSEHTETDTSPTT